MEKLPGVPQGGDNVRVLRMSNRSRADLETDLAKWGAFLGGKTVQQTIEMTGLTKNRAARLHSWFIRHGPDPRKASGEPAPEPVAEVPRSTDDGLHVLVVGDCHAAPEQDFRRFKWLARQVAALRPDLVVQIGDWYSLDALCRHSSFVDRTKERLVLDLAAGEDALGLFERELTRVAGDWRPERVITLGNHDNRLAALADDQPWLEGMFNVGKAHEAHGWTVVPFLEPWRKGGIRFQHYLTSEGGRSPLSGKYHSRRLLERTKYESIFVGHSHRLDVRVESDHRNRRTWGVVAGCYLEHDEPYAREDNREWFRGNLELHGVRDGDFDLTTWTMARIQRSFGD